MMALSDLKRPVVIRAAEAVEAAEWQADVAEVRATPRRGGRTRTMRSHTTAEPTASDSSRTIVRAQPEPGVCTIHVSPHMFALLAPFLSEIEAP